MIVVSNTSPLHYFILVGKADVLPRLFENIYVPPGVIGELSHASTPTEIQRWIVSRPSWLFVKALMRPLDFELAVNLDQGEAEAIQLAEEKSADLLILDDWEGRSIARQRGLPLTGALGILGLAYQKQILEDPLDVLAAMRERGFRIHDELAGRFQRLLTTRYAR